MVYFTMVYFKALCNCYWVFFLEFSSFYLHFIVIKPPQEPYSLFEEKGAILLVFLASWLKAMGLVIGCYSIHQTRINNNTLLTINLNQIIPHQSPFSLETLSLIFYQPFIMLHTFHASHNVILLTDVIASSLHKKPA